MEKGFKKLAKGKRRSVSPNSVSNRHIRTANAEVVDVIVFITTRQGDENGTLARGV